MGIFLKGLKMIKFIIGFICGAVFISFYPEYSEDFKKVYYKAENKIITKEEK